MVSPPTFDTTTVTFQEDTVSSITTLLAAGGPVAVAACSLSYIQRWSWRRPPRSEKEAAFRETWARLWPYPQLGVHVRADGYVFTNLAGHPIGPVAGARAEIVAATTITRVRAATAWAVIYFPDGSMHRQLVAVRDLPEARAQADRFNGHAKAAAPALFRRAWTP